MSRRPEVDNVTIIDEEDHNRFSRRGVNPDYAIFAMVVTFAIIVGVILAITLVLKWLELFLIVLFICLSLCPIVGLVYLCAKVYKYIRQPQIVTLDPTGTLFHRGNNVQVFSTNEVFAFETKDAPPVLPQLAQTSTTHFDYQYMPKEVEPAIRQSISDRQHPMEELHYNRPFTDSVNDGVNDRETVVEYIPTGNAQETQRVNLPVSQVLDVLESENEAAKNAMALQEKELTKARIVQFHKMHVPHGQIAVIVKMNGRKYKQYQSLCEELGIDTNA